MCPKTSTLGPYSFCIAYSHLHQTHYWGINMILQYFYITFQSMCQCSFTQVQGHVTGYLYLVSKLSKITFVSLSSPLKFLLFYYNHWSVTRLVRKDGLTFLGKHPRHYPQYWVVNNSKRQATAWEISTDLGFLYSYIVAFWINFLDNIYILINIINLRSFKQQCE